jgi:predicted site-specific integrase-resolvase
MKPTNPDRVFISIDDLAKRWALEPKTIRNWLGKSKIPFATKIGGVWRFPLDRVEKYESEQMVSTK